MKYGNVTLGQVEAVWNILGGEEGARLLSSGKTEVCWKTWRVVKLGTNLKTASDFRKALGGYHSGSSELDYLIGESIFTLATEKIEVELVKLSVRDLGLKDKVSYLTICEKAQKLGFKLCSAEVGLQLRLQYEDQPFGESLVIGMSPIVNSQDIMMVFSVECMNSSCTSAGTTIDPTFGVEFIDDEIEYIERSEFVFCK